MKKLEIKDLVVLTVPLRNPELCCDTLLRRFHYLTTCDTSEFLRYILRKLWRLLFTECTNRYISNPKFKFKTFIYPYRFDLILFSVGLLKMICWFIVVLLFLGDVGWSWWPLHERQTSRPGLAVLSLPGVKNLASTPHPQLPQVGSYAVSARVHIP